MRLLPSSRYASPVRWRPDGPAIFRGTAEGRLALQAIRQDVLVPFTPLLT